MSDLVKRLRQAALPDPYDERDVMCAPLLREAADELERLRHALTVIAEACEENVTDWTKDGCPPADALEFVSETERRARAALQPSRK